MIKHYKKKSSLDFFLFIRMVISEALQSKKNTHLSSLVTLRQILFTGFEALPLIGFIVDFCFEVPLVIVPGKRTIHVLEMEDVPEFEGFV